LEKEFKLERFLSPPTSTRAALLVLDNKREKRLLKLYYDYDCADEINALNLLKYQHHIIQLLDSFRVELDHGEYCTAEVFPFIDASKNPSTYRDMWLYLRQLFQAIDYCHLMKVIHADIKPTNVLFSNNELHLIDVGEAISFDKAEQEDGKEVGTPAYRSPEAWKEHTLKPATDLWGVAMIILEFVYGVVPFENLASSNNPYQQIAKFVHRVSSGGDFLCQSHPPGFTHSEPSGETHCRNMKLCLQHLLVLQPEKRIGARDSIVLINSFNPL